VRRKGYGASEAPLLAVLCITPEEAVKLTRLTMVLGAVLVPAAALAMGCSSSGSSSSPHDAGPTGYDGSVQDSGADSSAPQSDSGSQVDTGTGGGGSDSGSVDAGKSCKTAGDAAACQQCCEDAPPLTDGGINQGYLVFLESLVGCACKLGSGPCEVACATEACIGKAPTTFDTCATCLAGVFPPDGGPGACSNQVDTACKASAECLSFSQCFNGCPK
jgi:hypothetical protein